MKSFKQFLLEMPQHYPGNVTYQKDNKFTPISLRNVMDYTVLHDDGEYVYMVDPGQTTGYVFDLNDLRKDAQHILPVMRLSLRSTTIKGYKQAHYLRIREAFAKNNITSTWYNHYVMKFGGIVSDMEHLEGGKMLWQSFIKKALSDPLFNVYLVDTTTDKRFPITKDTTENEIWSKDSSLKNLVIVYETV